MWHHKIRRAGGAALGARLEADVGGISSAIANLPRDITINGQTVSPTFRYEAKNATTGLWTATVGENLTGAGSGGLVGLDTPLLDSSDKAVNGDGTRYWQAGNSAFGDVTTEDFVVEIIGTTSRPGKPPPSTGILFAKKPNTAASTSGLIVYVTSNGETPVFMIADGVNRKFASVGGQPLGTYFHWIWFGDRSGNMSLYVNGALTNNILISDVAGSLSNSTNLTLNAYDNGTVAGETNIAYAAMHQRNDWLDTHLQADLAQERFARLNGSYVPNWRAWPTLASLRNSIATLEKQSPDGGQKQFTVGPRWSRLERRPDKYLRYANGFNCEGQHTNVITWSEAFDNAAWIKTRCTIDNNSGAAPNYETTMDTIVEDGTAADTHFVENTFTQSASPYTFMAVVEAMGRSWVQLELDSSTDGAASAYVELSSGFIGTESGNDKARSRYLGAGLHLVSITDTRATAETCSARVYSSDGDNGRSYNGASIDAIRVWGAQVTATSYPVSYIKTEGAAVTKLGQSIRYDSITIPASYTIAVDFLGAQQSASVSNGLADISDGTASNWALLYRSVGTSKVNAFINGQANSASADDYEANRWHEARGTFETDNVVGYLDGSAGTPDTSAIMPSGVNTFTVGNYYNGNNDCDCLVRARLYSKPTTKFVTDFGDIMSRSSAYISTPAAVAQSTAYANVGGTWTEVSSSDFTVSSAGVFTYTGTDTKRFAIVASCSGDVNSGTPLITTAIEKNGTPLASSEITRKVGSVDIGAWACTADVELATSDTINFATKVDTGTPNLTMDTLSVVILEIS